MHKTKSDITSSAVKKALLRILQLTIPSILLLISFGYFGYLKFAEGERVQGVILLKLAFITSIGSVMTLAMLSRRKQITEKNRNKWLALNCISILGASILFVSLPLQLAVYPIVIWLLVIGYHINRINQQTKNLRIG